MSWASDDLTPLLAGGSTKGLGYRQGIVQAWNTTTGANTVEVDGALLDDLPILNTTEALLLAPGDVVGILTTGQAARSWFILGRITEPGSAAAASALSAIRTHTAVVSATEATASATWTDLITPGPVVSDVLIGSSGRCQVWITAGISVTGASGTGRMGYEISGATSVPADTNTPVLSCTGAAGSGLTATRLALVTGLTPGLHTFTAKYITAVSPGGQAEFAGRTLTVIPL